jgi:hypothetical protein
MDIKKAPVIILLIMAITCYTHFFFFFSSGQFCYILAPFIILANFVFANIIIKKTSYNQHQQLYQHRTFYTVKRIQRTIATGVVTTFAIGFSTKSLIQPLLPNHFWGIYLIILFAIGAIIGDTLQRML